MDEESFKIHEENEGWDSDEEIDDALSKGQ